MEEYNEILEYIKNELDLGKTEIDVSLCVSDAVKVFDGLKTQRWNDTKIITKVHFSFSFEFEKNSEPSAQIDINFFNAVSIFKLWRNHFDTFKFIIDEKYYFKFVSYLNRFVYFILDKNKKNGGFWVNGKKIENQGFGGLGNTGLPIIPIDEKQYNLLRKNIFDYLAGGTVKYGYEMEGFKKSFNKKIKSITSSIKIEDCQYRKDDRSIDKFNKLKDIEKLRVVYWCKLQEINEAFDPIYLFCLLGMDKILEKITPKEFDFIKHMNVLTFLLFNLAIEAIYHKGEAISTRKERERLFEGEDFLIFYENCNQYSMGILQLLENTIAHACGGFFSFRIVSRKSKNNYQKWVEGFYKKDEWDFIQVYIADLAKKDEEGNCKNLVETFRNKLENRNPKIEIKSEIKLKDLYIDSNENSTAGKKRKKDGTIEYKNLKSYLQDNNTIAHHYGLQVFVFSIISQMGHFSVISGNHEGCEHFDSSQIPFYIDDKKVEASEYYNSADEDKYYCGTYYSIQLPIAEIIKANNENCASKYYMPNDLTFDAETNSKEEEIEYIAPSDFELKNKEETIENCVKNVKEELIHRGLSINGRSVITIKLKDTNVENSYSNLEIFAKVIFLLISEKSEGDVSPLRNIVVKRFSNVATVSSFINLYSQFYDRFGKNPTINPSPQIMLMYQEDGVDNYLTLSGKYLGRPLYDYKNFSGGEYNDNGYVDIIMSKIFRESSKKSSKNLLPNAVRTYNNPHFFDNVKVNDKTGKIKKWQRDLYSILTTPLADKERYGVLINNEETHMHISGVHLDRFYKVESLFTNAYWSKKFSQALCEYIEGKIEERLNPKEETQKTVETKKVVLYGYERLTEPMFIDVKKRMRSKGIDVDYIIYDAGYHYTAEKTTEPQISGLNNVKDNFLDEECIVIYVMSISTTCKTFFKMNKKLRKELEIRKVKKYKSKNYYYAVIQLFDESINKIHNECGIRFKDNNIKRVDGELAKNKEETEIDVEETEILVKYLIAVPAKWSLPNKCKLCCPEDGKPEMAIFSTDDTSLVPTFMIVNKEKNPKDSIDKKDYQFDFFEKEGNEFKFKDALIYRHTVRGNSHYRSYVETDKLIEIIRQDEDAIKDKFSKIDLLSNKDKKNNRNLDDFINIIVAPYHITNQNFPSLINEKLFNGRAHIISFNASKIFRSNFLAEFDSFKDLIDRIKLRENDVRSYVRFYYVDDQINSGGTFNRAKTLVRDLVEGKDDGGENNGNSDGKSDEDSSGEFDFNAILLLIDRHSDATKKSFIKDTQKYFSLFSFSSPNLRSMGDMCPLCKQVAMDRDYLKDSGLSSIAEFCYERMYVHKAREISIIKENPLTEAHRRRGARRFYIEEQIYRDVLSNTEPTEKPEWERLYRRLVDELERVTKEPSTAMENSISFVKNLSRPFFSYRPALATATIKLIKNLLNAICDNVKEIQENKLTLDVEEDSKITYDLTVSKLEYDNLISLLLVCVSGLSNLNSTYLLTNLDYLKKIIETFRAIKDKLVRNEFSSVKDKTIFIYYPDDKIKDEDGKVKQEFAKKSFADYLRFSVFRLIRSKPYGEFRRENFESLLFEKLNSVDELKKDKELKYFYVLLYMENEDSNIVKKTQGKAGVGIDILQKRMEEQISPNEALAGCDGYQSNSLSDIILNCEPYMIENGWLIPLTPDGYDDAFLVGYGIKEERAQESPIETAYDDKSKQLCGKLKLKDDAMQALQNVGISWTDNDDDKYVFVLLKNFDIDHVEDTSGATMVLRFKVEELEAFWNRYVEEYWSEDAKNAHNSEGRNIMNFMRGFRLIISLRKEFLRKLLVLLNSGTLNKLREQNEKNTALSISKAGKHGNAKLECIMGSGKYAGKESFNKIHKLIANRVISAIYRMEAIVYKDGKDIGKPYSNEIIDIFNQSGLNGIEDDNNISATEEMAKDILREQGLEILGRYGEDKEENAGDQANAKIFIKGEEDQLSEQSDLRGITYNEIDLHNINVFVYSIILFAYNAIRHSRFYLDENNERFLRLSIETNEDKRYFVCASNMTKDEYDKDNIEKARKSIAIPPWIREGESNERGITLWTLGRYYKRCWESVERKDGKKDVFDVFEVFNVDKETAKGEYFFKIKIRIK